MVLGCGTQGPGPQQVPPCLIRLIFTASDNIHVWYAELSFLVDVCTAPCTIAEIDCGVGFTGIKLWWCVAPPDYFTVVQSLNGQTSGGIRLSCITPGVQCTGVQAKRNFVETSDPQFKHRQAIIGLLSL